MKARRGEKMIIAGLLALTWANRGHADGGEGVAAAVSNGTWQHSAKYPAGDTYEAAAARVQAAQSINPGKPVISGEQYLASQAATPVDAGSVFVRRGSHHNSEVKK